MASTESNRNPNRPVFDKTVPWYTKDADLPQLPPAVRNFFEQYSNISEGEVQSHVLAVREQAWQIYSYPCIGQMKFLDFPLATMPSYAAIVARLSDPGSDCRLIDVGCAFGADLRKLVLNGAIGSNGRLTGLDIEPKFIDLGFELFQDRHSFPGRFVVANILDDAPANPAHSLARSADIVHAAAFLHLFRWDEQVQACICLIRLLKDQPGTMVLGRQFGSTEPKEYPHTTNPSGFTFSHDETTFTQLWKEVGKETNTQWHVQASFFQPTANSPDAGPANWKGSTFRTLYFEVTRS
ncbi:MAG: hypothetical protein M1822_004027 [Bathelium mastoideum]|nr:MAG: hypothetical protein M1822_004027 [Bathelium mastoideum]